MSELTKQEDIAKKDVDIPLKTTVEGHKIECAITGEVEDFKDFLGLETSGAIKKRVHQLALTAPKHGKGNEPDPQGLEKSMREMQELGPRDAVESQIMIQMVALNDMFCEVTAYFNNKDTSWNLRRQAMDNVMKVSRTYQGLANTLRQWRTQGVQTVKHVHVNDGGQAAFIEQYTKGGG